MSSEERQRTIREQGSRPAEAEKEEAARTAREALGQQESERQTEQEDGHATAPMSEDDASKPRPRR
jgi:osmotically-inducible protein OsmY